MDHTRYSQLNGLSGVASNRRNDENEANQSATNTSQSQELEIQPLKEKETNFNDFEDDDDEFIMNVNNNNIKKNNNKTPNGIDNSIVVHENVDENGSPYIDKNLSSSSSIAQTSVTSLKTVLNIPKTLALNLNGNSKTRNDYELKNFYENEAKQIKTPLTPSYHAPPPLNTPTYHSPASTYQASNTPTNTNSLKRLFSKKSKHPVDNGNEYDSLDEDVDDNDLNDGFGDDILSQSLTSNNVTNSHINKRTSLSKPSLRNIVVPLQSPNTTHPATSRNRTISGSSSKGVNGCDSKIHNN